MVVCKVGKTACTGDLLLAFESLQDDYNCFCIFFKSSDIRLAVILLKLYLLMVYCVVPLENFYQISGRDIKSLFLCLSFEGSLLENNL